jgi:hypothetical protein
VESTTELREGVLYGEPAGEADDAVVFLTARGELIARCSATMVAPNLLITARHCIAEFSHETFSCTPEGELAAGSEGGAMGPILAPEKISITTGQDPGLSAQPVALGRQIFSVQTASICRSDIAMVLLDRDLPDLPIKRMRLGQGNTRGETLRVVGYGLDQNNVFGKRNTRSGLRIDEVGESEFRENGDPVPPRTFSTLGPALCSGDSGGPAFTENEAITAVWSQVVGDCKADEARNYFTQIAPFENTIVRPAFEAAGYEPLLEEDEPIPGTGGAPSTDAGAGGEFAAAGNSNPGAGGEPSPGSGGSSGSAQGGEASNPAEGGAGGETPDVEPPTYRGPRKSGGLKCEFTANGAESRSTWPVSLLFGLLWLARRVRSRKEGS